MEYQELILDMLNRIVKLEKEIESLKSMNAKNASAFDEIAAFDEAKPQQRDKTRYMFNGNIYLKNKLVLAVVKDYISKNQTVTCGELKTIFDKSLQGSIGVVEHEFVAKQIEVFGEMAKNGLIYELNKFGVPCVGVSGWEYDDLAWLASCMLYGVESKPSVIITKDSDLQYAISPQMDYFRIPTGGSEPQIITYNEMYAQIPDRLKGKVSLYQYKSFMDSLGEGHNDMRKTKKILNM